MNFTVIGAGNTGYACTCYLMDKGYSVTLYTRDEEKAEEINASGITAAGAIEGNFTPKATCQLDRAVMESQYIFLTTQSDAHLNAIEAMADYVTSGHRIIIINGSWGAYEAHSVLGGNEKIFIGETAAPFFIARRSDNRHIHILAVNREVEFSAVTDEKTRIVVEEMKDIFPQLRPASSILETSLRNIGPILRVPLALLNMSRLERGEVFPFWKEGVTPAGVTLIEKTDNERMAVAKGLGITLTPVLERIHYLLDAKYDNLYDALTKDEICLKIEALSTLTKRDLIEDIIFGIIPLVALGERLQMETPVSVHLYRIFEMILPEDSFCNVPDYDKIEEVIDR
jgi:opine dehydrogenase